MHEHFLWLVPLQRSVARANSGSIVLARNSASPSVKRKTLLHGDLHCRTPVLPVAHVIAL